MNKIVCGADVCKNSIVCCFLSEIPEDVNKFFKQNASNFPKFKANLEDAQKFLEHKPTHLILEPTGTHYAWIFAELAEQQGIKILWAPNHKCKALRNTHDLPGKNDAADALALALTGLIYSETSSLWLKFSHRDGLYEMRQLVLQHESINRMKSPVVNRLRQQLAHEFPEAALNKTKVASDRKIPLWAWLAGISRNLKRKSSTYDKLWDESIAKLLGLEISPFTKALAKTLDEYETQQQHIEALMLKMLKEPHIKPYHEVLSRFNLNIKLQTMIIAMAYPLERFFDGDGMRNARARFKQRLGLGKIDDSSGDKKASKAGGSALCRKMLYIHIMHNYTAENPKSWTKETDLVLSYYRQLVNRWNSDPKAIALRERKLASQKAAASLEKELTGLVDKATIKKLKQAIVANVESDFDLLTNNEIVASRWKKLVIIRTAAKLCEYLWQALLDEIYPKKQD